MPSNSPRVKRQATLELGAQVVDVGPASSDRLSRAQELIGEHGYVVVPPYDDAAILAGQATCGLEIAADCPQAELVLVPVSGGGLLGGVAAAIKQTSPATRVVGVEPELAGDACASFRERRLVSWPAELTSRTIADGLRTQSLGELNFLHIERYVDDIVTVGEEEIRAAMRVLLLSGRILAEPSGAVAAAALLFHPGRLPAAKTAVAVVSGGNVDPGLLGEILAAPPA
jgi:threonine dehydratase